MDTVGEHPKDGEKETSENGQNGLEQNLIKFTDLSRRRFSKVGKIGGKATFEKYGKDHFSKAGKIGGQKC